MAVKNWSYRAYLNDTDENERHVSDVLYRCNRYRNDLVAIELERRKLFDAFMQTLSPEYQQAIEECERLDGIVDAAYAEQAEYRKKNRTRDVSEEISQKIEVARQHRSLAWKRKASLAGSCKELVTGRLVDIKRDLFYQLIDGPVHEVQVDSREIFANKTKRQERLESRSKVKQSLVTVLSGKPKKDIGRSGEKLVFVPQKNILTLVREDGSQAGPWRKKALNVFLAKAISEKGLDDGADRINQRRAEVRASCGLPVGCYLSVEDAIDKTRRGNPPRFKRYTGEGMLSVFFSKEMPVSQLIAGGNSWLRFEMPGYSKVVAKGRMSHRAAMARVGVRCFRGKEERFIWFDVVVHRPLPENATIRSVHIDVKREGPRRVFQLRLNLDGVEAKTRRCAKGAVTVHLGSRVLSNGDLRVAMWHDGSRERPREMFLQDLCKEGVHVPSVCELLIDRETINTLTHADEVKSARSLRFNEMVELLRLECKRSSVPPWIVEDMRYSANWKDPSRLVRLVTKWSKERFDGDECLFTKYDEWVRWNRVEYLREVRVTRRLREMRDTCYATLAKRLWSTYEKCVSPEIDWAVLREKESSPLMDIARRYASFAAPGILEQKLSGVFLDSLEKPSGKHITTTCWSCGHVNEGVGRKQWHRCTGCGQVWDIDWNGLLNSQVGAERLRGAG